jgi:hypothetical protein
MWQSSSEASHQGESYLNQHKEGQIWGYFKQPCMGKVWFIMKTLEQHVLSLQDPQFELPSNLVDVIENQFYQKWKMLMTDLHYVKFFSIHTCWVKLTYMMM